MIDKIVIRCIGITQPIGTFYIGVINHAELLKISYVDQRKVASDIDDYMGIQRKLSKPRVAKIQDYVKNVDATFPTSVILSIDDQNCEWNEAKSELTIFGTDDVPLNTVAKVLAKQFL